MKISCLQGDWAARRLWKLRISEPGLLILHGQRVFQPDRRKKADLLIGEEGPLVYRTLREDAHCP